VPQLEEVDGTDSHGLGRTCQFLALRVPREERREPVPAIGEREVQHDGVLVLVSPSGTVRPNDPKREPPDAHHISPADFAAVDSRQKSCGIPKLWGNVARGPLSHEHRTHRDAPQKGPDTAVVVVVQMRDHHRIEPPHIEPCELTGAGVVCRTGVDEDGGPAVLHQDGIPLPNVENAHAWSLEHPGAEGEYDRHAERECHEGTKRATAWMRPEGKNQRERDHRGKEATGPAHECPRRPGKAGQQGEHAPKCPCQRVESETEGTHPKANVREERMRQPHRNHRVGNRRQEHAGKRTQQGQSPKCDGGDGERRRLRRERRCKGIHERPSAVQCPPARRPPHEQTLEVRQPQRRPQRPGEVPAQGAQAEHGAHGEEESKVTGKVRVCHRHAERHDASGTGRVGASAGKLRPHCDEGHEPGADGGDGRPTQQHEDTGQRGEQGNPRRGPKRGTSQRTSDDPRDDGEVTPRHGNQVRDPAQLDELVRGVSHQGGSIPAAHAGDKGALRRRAWVQSPDEGLPKPEDRTERAPRARGAADVRDAHGGDDSPGPARDGEVVVPQLSQPSHARDGMPQTQLLPRAEVHVGNSPVIQARLRPGEEPAAGGMGVLDGPELERRDGDG
jgi:hypothetical protein